MRDAHRSCNALFALRQRPSTATAKKQCVHRAEVHDFAIVVERGGDQRLSGQHSRATKALGKRTEVGHTVQQRNDHRVASDP